MTLDNNQQAFFALVRGGLWEKDVQLAQFGSIDFKEVYRLAQEQAVVGLVAAGLEHVIDIKVPPVDALIIAGDALELEQTNTEMNKFIASLVEQMKDAGIYALLVKGQGIAQCYERPLWRSCGDVDLLLSESNYEIAKKYFHPIATIVEIEGRNEKHQGYTIGNWALELHGTLRCGLSYKMDRVIDEVQNDSLCKGSVRDWINGCTQVSLPDVNCDILFIFTHFIKHFYKGGLGLRQICDWCRLMWTYKDEIDVSQLEDRLVRMGLMTEWKAFAALVVEHLGMPINAMPFYDSSNKWSKKAFRILRFLLDVGNFGQNRDSSYYAKYPLLQRKAISFGRRIKDHIHHSIIFPLDSVRFLSCITVNGIESVIHGE